MIAPLIIAASFAPAYAPPPCLRVCHERAEWRDYKANPMPWCTWALESGPPRRGYGQWAHARYRVKNPSSTASGKFQVLTSTWWAYGGGRYATEARFARRIHQERVARRIAYSGTVAARPQGLGAWVGC